MKRIAILGSTGSIGTNALDVIRQFPDRFKVVALAANNNYRLLARQAKKFNIKKIALSNADQLKNLQKQIPSDIKIYAGIDGVSEIAALKEVDFVIMAIGGTASLIPLVEAIKAGKDVALASKETLVSAGEIIIELARKQKINLIPVDSEHSAVFQCLQGNDIKFLKNIYLTGTGGPLRKVKKSFFDKLPIARVIKHPKWKMGRKITVDSATLMNKGLEVIEARWLFDVNPKNIKVLLHPEAVIHSMVEFIDGTVLANLFYPDMKIPISYALNFPERLENGFQRLDFLKVKKLTFERPSFKKFPALMLAYEAINRGISACAVLNAANEEAVYLYLNGKIKFTKIIDSVEKALKLHRSIKKPTLKDILRLDKWAREEVRRLCS